MRKTSIYTVTMNLSKVVVAILILLTMVSFDWISHIKKHEGLRLTPYKCPAGVSTIGYGHAIRKTDTFGNCITVEIANEILQADFTRSVARAKSLHPEFDTVQWQAIGHLIYAIGVGNYTKSKLYTALKVNAHPDLIYEYWMEFAYFRGNLHMRKLKNRNLEYIQWNYKQISSTSCLTKRLIPILRREES